MAKPTRVRIVDDEPSIFTTIFVGMLVLAFVVVLVKWAIIVAAGVIAVCIILRVFSAVPGPSIYFALWAGGTYLMRSSWPIMLGWTTLAVFGLMLILRYGAKQERAEAPIALPPSN